MFFSQDGNGFISKKELRLAMGKQGRKLTKQQIDKLMKETDVDGDGQISYEEFLRSIECLLVFRHSLYSYSSNEIKLYLFIRFCKKFFQCVEW